MNNKTKQYIKSIINIFSFSIVFPLIICYIVVGCFVKKDSIFWTLSQLLSLIPGVFGNFLRKNFYHFTMYKCNYDCSILFGTIFAQVDTEIGKGVYIGPNCNVGKSKIEDFCTIGSNVHILSGRKQHNFDDLNIPVKDQGGHFEKITIGEDTWIGNCSVIMANIGKKSIIGAGSIVTKDVEDFSIVAGNPAKIIRKRI